MRVNLDELYVICRENEPTEMHTGHYSASAPKFYPKGCANAPCAKLNKSFENICNPFDPSIYDRRYFTKEAIKGFEIRHAKNVIEQMRMGPWVVRKASDVFQWKN
jgi:hypothetical protein